MGIIMKDGHQYGIGGIERAEDVSYDNTESGMTATDVQGALDELSAGLSQLPDFEFGDTTNSGTTRTITLQGSFSEMLYFTIQPKQAMNINMPRGVTFTAPSTVTYQLSAGGSQLTETVPQKYMFIGVRN